MRIADTSCLYGAFFPEDAHFERARAALRDPEPIIIPSEILAETLGLIQLRHKFATALAAGRYLRALRHVRIDGASPALVAAAWETFEESGGKLSLPDALVIAWCEAQGASALSFDDEILRRVGSRE
jgi:predicted nucleic acid-binding protein